MKPTTLQDYERRLLRVLVFIQEHLDEDLGLERLARLACFSPHHFHRVFSGMVGESLARHVRRLRLERAAVRLKLGDAPVTELAFQAGFGSHEAFTRAFSAMFGRPPRDFRLEHASELRRPSPSGVHFGELDAFRSLEIPMDLNVEIVRLPPRKVAFVRHVGPYDACGAAWEALLPVLGKEGLLGGGAELLGICHDDPEITPPERLRYDACVTIAAKDEPPAGLATQTIPAGEYATATHHGPYSGLGETYAQLLGRWLPRSGRELGTSPCFEIYLNDPEGTDPEDLLTDVFAPLEPRS